MCGIVGYLSADFKIEVDHFNEMRDELYHRGPDSGNSVSFLEGHLMLGHRRLSIIDLSEQGAQPMSNEDETIWMTLNGEIYNYEELRRTLKEKGHQFKSSTDSEVIIHGYEEWGIDGLLTRIEGMFAFGLYDSNNGKLILVRDRLGIKPLYYMLKNNMLIFASELKAIVKWDGFKKRINRDALGEYLRYRYIPVPNTIWEGVYKLPPANVMEYDIESHEHSIDTYWKLSKKELGSISFEEACEQTEELFSRSIKSHMASDVPVGVLLSGGYDSGALVALMVEQGYHPESFSIGFDNWKNSEHKIAELVANKFGLQHHEKILKENLVEGIDDLFYYYDEPFGDSSMIPTYELSSLVYESGIKVVLGGDGGDEFFGGYNWYYSIVSKYGRSVKGAGRLLGLARRNRERGLREYSDFMNWGGYSLEEINQLTDGSSNQEIGELHVAYYQAENTVLKGLQNIDINTFLPEVVLNKVDRASMAKSLEVRVPFLDRELVEYLWSLPDSIYFKPGHKKVLLEKIIESRLPQEVLTKPKTGFGAPINRIGDLVRIYSEKLQGGTLEKTGLINPKMIYKYIEDRKVAKLWPLYLLELWARKWLK